MRFTENETCVTAYPVGRLDIGDAHLLDRELFQILGERPRKDLILNLEAVEYISSSGLSTFVSISRSLEGSKRSLRLCRVSARVKQIIEVVGMAEHFHIYESEDEAIAAIRDQ